MLAAAEPPPRAWIILRQEWEYNDEWTYPVGETAMTDLYYDQAAAEAACRKLNEEFYAHQTPAEFEVDLSNYFPEGLSEGKSETDITWEELQAAGWPDPFLLQQLSIPGVEPHE